jgi:hypothetical protein
MKSSARRFQGATTLRSIWAADSDGRRPKFPAFTGAVRPARASVTASSASGIDLKEQSKASDYDYDVCIIGGGIVGVSTAYELLTTPQTGTSSAPMRVVLLEARRIGQGTTGYSTAKITSQQTNIYSKLAEKHNKETARLYGQMQEAGIARFDRIGTCFAITASVDTTRHTLCVVVLY